MSNAERRSVATSSRSSPRANISRTFPRLTWGRGSSRSVIARVDLVVIGSSLCGNTVASADVYAAHLAVALHEQGAALSGAQEVDQRLGVVGSVEPRRSERYEDVSLPQAQAPEPRIGVHGLEVEAGLRRDAEMGGQRRGQQHHAGAERRFD